MTTTNSRREWAVPIGSATAIGARSSAAPEVGTSDRSSDGEDVLLNVDEAAAWLRVSPETVKYLRSQRRFAPAIKIGRRVMWLRSDLVAWRDLQREHA